MEIAAVPMGAWQSLEAIAAMDSTSRTPGNVPDWPFCALFLLLLLLPVLVIVIVRARKKKDAKGAYYDSLQRLKQNPGNRRLQARTVKRARKYIRSARDSRGHSDVDEPAIIDELFAALHQVPPSQLREANVEGTEAAAPPGKQRTDDGGQKAEG
jgi:hypothetical protein